MSDLSNYAENALVNALLRAVNFTAPTTVYLALFTAVSDAEGGVGTEVSVSGYARQPIAFDAPANGVTQNTAVEDFGPLLGAGTVTHAGIFDAVTGGNALTVLKPLAVSRTFASGDIIRFAAGDVDFSLA